MPAKSKPATCHPERKSRALGLCRQCYNAQLYQRTKKEHAERGRNWRHKNRERVNEVTRIWIANNPEKRKASRQKFQEKNKEALRLKQREYRKNNKDSIREKNLVKNITEEKRLHRNKYHAEWRAKNKDKMQEARRKRNAKPNALRKHLLKYAHGLTLEQYDELLHAQNSVCAICQTTCNTKKVLSVDHDHNTGAIRGLLCNACNQALGLLKDNPDIAFNANIYLRRCKQNI